MASGTSTGWSVRVAVRGVCPEDSPELKRHIAFRDYLRSHPDAVQEYSRIKEEAASFYPYDIDQYIGHKSPVIEKIYKEIGL